MGGGRHIIPIQKSGMITQFRLVGLLPEPTQPTRHPGTKWASCEMKSKQEKKVEFGIVGMSSGGHPIYGTATTKMVVFKSPCPLGTPPKLPKPLKPKTPAQDGTGVPNKPNQVPQ